MSRALSQSVRRSPGRLQARPYSARERRLLVFYGLFTGTFVKKRGGLPWVLCDAFEETWRYLVSPTHFPALNLANGSPRQQRLERTTATYLVLVVLLKHYDLATGQIACPIDAHRVMGQYALATIAEESGVPLYTVHRVVKDLKVAGFLTVSQRRERSAAGDWHCHVAVKSLTDLFFEQMGLKGALDKARAWARQLREKRWGRRSPRELGRAKSLHWTASAQQTQRRLPGFDQPQSSRGPPKSTFGAIFAQLSSQDRLRLLKLAEQLRHAHPEWSTETLKAAALKHITG